MGLLLALASVAAQGATWFPLGPYGGDARAFGADPGDPKHLYLGTTTGWIYDSHDSGSTWSRVAHLGTADDLVIREILVDPKSSNRLIVGAWRIDRPDGGVFISEDGGKHWYEQAEMRGQSVRSMARSVSDPRELVAGTLQGVFLSKDGGTHWSQISPAGSTEIHEVESLAIDPVDPNVIYAGTWHLPWKTTDGGVTWTNIKQGIIEDSDVFSIIVDPADPRLVYASACSGIYKSLNAGEQFLKIPPKTQAMPSSARRTRKLLQDPSDPKTVFAGTTEGLYRTRNGGDSFQRTTPGDVIVNDVYVDPSHPAHVLLATDRGGVLSSDDGGDTFQPSNTGFSARQVLAFAADAQNPGTLYVGVVNDKATGGVFQSVDGGVQWVQQSTGLGGRDVFSLVSTTAGTLLAGTSHGIFRFEAGAWTSSDALDSPIVVPAVAIPVVSTAAPLTSPLTAPRAPVSARVVSAPAMPHEVRVSFESSRQAKGARIAPPKGTHAAAAKSKAPLATRAKARTKPGRPAVHHVAAAAVTQRAPAGQRTRPLRLPPSPPPAAIVQATAQQIDATVYGMVPLSDSVYAATSSGLLRSRDDGHRWTPVASLTMAEVRFIAGQKNIVLAGGLKRLALSVDDGVTWDSRALPNDLTQLSSMTVDELGNLWVGGAEGVFYSTDYGLSWKTLRNLFTTEVDGIFFDAANHRVLVTASNSTITFAAHLPDYKVSFWDTGWHLRFVRPVGDHLIGATLYDGMVLQPRMVAPTAEKADAAASAVPPTVPAQP